MLSFHAKLAQTDRRTDRGKTICLQIFQYGGIKMLINKELINQDCLVKTRVNMTEL